MFRASCASPLSGQRCALSEIVPDDFVKTGAFNRSATLLAPVAATPGGLQRRGL
jgi:hypothetical protein